MKILLTCFLLFTSSSVQACVEYDPSTGEYTIDSHGSVKKD